MDLSFKIGWILIIVGAIVAGFGVIFSIISLIAIFVAPATPFATMLGYSFFAVIIGLGMTTMGFIVSLI